MKKVLTLAAVAVLAASTAFAANTITVTNGAAMNGTTFGMQTNLDGSTNNVFVESQHPNNETHYRARFWLNVATTKAMAPTTNVPSPTACCANQLTLAGVSVAGRSGAGSMNRI